MNKQATVLLALLTVSCGDRLREQNPSRVVGAPPCWTSGMVRNGDTLKGLGTAFCNPDGPLERAVLKEMREKSTGGAFGGQHYVVRFEGVVEGNGTDGTNLRVDKLKLIRRVDNKVAFGPRA